MSISRTPHNDFFYQVMSRKSMAKTFFERYLPKQVLAITNLEEITLAESKHVSDAGISLYNDVLYRCELEEGQAGYLFAMCEHQSTPEAQMPLRLLKYNIATIDKHIKQDQGRFPVIVNIVLYHG
jgi:predicted transposase/invertase (TIGR01784 family)